MQRLALEVLHDERVTALDQAVSGNDAVARDQLLFHAEVAAPVRDQPIEFLEGARIVEQLDSLAGSQLASGMLALEPIGTADKFSAPIEVSENVFGLHRVEGIML